MLHVYFGEMDGIIYNTEAKRPHLLIEAFARIARDFPDWHVELWGAEDKQRYTQELQHLIQEYHLEQQAFLKGSTGIFSISSQWRHYI